MIKVRIHIWFQETRRYNKDGGVVKAKKEINVEEN